MDNIKLVKSNKYKKILDLLEKRIYEKDFEKQLLKAQDIDLNHYEKKVSIEELKKYIMEYKEKEYKENLLKKVQVLLPGNPEIIFQVCLELIRYNIQVLICIEDFCLAQNTLIIEVFNEILEDCKIKNKFELKNLVKEKEILDNSMIVDKTICIGDSNLHNRLDRKIQNYIFYPYGILDMYSSSEEFEELKRKIYEYAMQNQFEIEIYDDLDLEEAIKFINKDSYHFCSLLISKDKQEMEMFRKNVKSEYIVINENPFKKMKFNLDII